MRDQRPFGTKEGTTYARPLSEKRIWNDSQHSASVPRGSEKGLVGRIGVGLLVEQDGLFDLLVFKLQQGVGFIPVAMIKAQGLQSLFILTLGDEPSRRFGDHKEDQAHLEE